MTMPHRTNATPAAASRPLRALLAAACVALAAPVATDGVAAADVTGEFLEQGGGVMKDVAGARLDACQATQRAADLLALFHGVATDVIAGQFIQQVAGFACEIDRREMAA